MELVHDPVRRSLRRFARAVDVEVVMQETFLRMWLVATDPERRLEGENASLRFATRMARNVALEEVRRLGGGRLVPIEDLDNPALPSVEPDPPSDPALRRAIRDCVEQLPKRPGEALQARIRSGHATADRDLAASLNMKVNTFLQNIVRARRLLRTCLEGKGVPLSEIVS
jgi:DNA-directed RNA polymerase specialized sigma24 family protein